MDEDVFGRWTELGGNIYYHKTSAAFAIYNWELGYHVPCLIMERLMATQQFELQFELTLKIAGLVFNPSTSGDDIGRSFPPFREDCALDLAEELKRAGEKLLSIEEKGDAEELSSLRLKHQNTVLALYAQQNSVMRLSHVLALTGDKKELLLGGGQPWQDITQIVEPPVMNGDTTNKIPMSRFGQMELDLAQDAAEKTAKAMLTRIGADLVSMMPIITANVAPFGVGESTEFSPQEIAAPMLAAANGLEAIGQLKLAQSRHAASIGAATRNLQQRRLEANTCGREIIRIDKETAQIRAGIATCETQIQMQQLDLDNAAAQYEWLQAKYTKRELYAVLENAMRTLFHRTYTMATEMAKSAQRAMAFELALRSKAGSGGTMSNPTIASSTYWEIARDGQLSGRPCTSTSSGWSLSTWTSRPMISRSRKTYLYSLLNHKYHVSTDANYNGKRKVTFSGPIGSPLLPWPRAAKT
ncbi:hypothetical protein BDW66DRAFT_152676 [Aspergillus desertorum]